MPVEDYEKIYSLKVENISEDRHILEDIPHEFRVVRLESVSSGIMVWGRFNDRWYPNPSCRFLVAHLLKAVEAGAAGSCANHKCVLEGDNVCDGCFDYSPPPA